MDKQLARIFFRSRRNSVEKTGQMPRVFPQCSLTSKFHAFEGAEFPC